MPKKQNKLSRQIWFEHECLKRTIGVIKEEISTANTAANFIEWKMEFIWRLKDFRKHLTKHFSVEEEAGFTNQLSEPKPEIIRQVKKLESEHDQIIESIDFVLNELTQLRRQSNRKLTSLQSWINDLLLHIEEHENAEMALLQKVNPRQYGVID